MELTRKKQLLLLSAALLLLLNSVVAVAYYWTLQVPSEKVITYNATVYVNGTQWSNGTKLTWGNSDQLELDVLNVGSTQTHVYVTTEGLPTGWNLTWSKNGMTVLPDTWLNGTLTLEHTYEPGNYTWTMYINLSE